MGPEQSSEQYKSEEERLAAVQFTTDQLAKKEAVLEKGFDEGTEDNSRIYENPQDDPLIKTYETDILSRTNLDSQVKNSNKATGIDGYGNIWNRVNARENIHGWSDFLDKYPEKAKSYAEKGYEEIQEAFAGRERLRLYRERQQSEGTVKSDSERTINPVTMSEKVVIDDTTTGAEDIAGQPQSQEQAGRLEETPAISTPQQQPSEEGVWHNESDYQSHIKEVKDNLLKDAQERFEEARLIAPEQVVNIFQTDNYFILQQNLLQLNRQDWQGVEGSSGNYKTNDLLHVVDQIPVWVKTYEQQKMTDEQLEKFLSSQGVTRGNQEIPFRECVKKCIKNAWKYEVRNHSQNR